MPFTCYICPHCKTKIWPYELDESEQVFCKECKGEVTWEKEEK